MAVIRLGTTEPKNSRDRRTGKQTGRAEEWPSVYLLFLAAGVYGLLFSLHGADGIFWQGWVVYPVIGILCTAVRQCCFWRLRCSAFRWEWNRWCSWRCSRSHSGASAERREKSRSISEGEKNEVFLPDAASLYAWYSRSALSLRFWGVLLTQNDSFSRSMRQRDSYTGG